MMTAWAQGYECMFIPEAPLTKSLPAFTVSIPKIYQFTTFTKSYTHQNIQENRMLISQLIKKAY